jgi:hypothetical protein
VGCPPSGLGEQCTHADDEEYAETRSIFPKKPKPVREDEWEEEGEEEDLPGLDSSAFPILGVAMLLLK